LHARLKDWSVMPLPKGDALDEWLSRRIEEFFVTRRAAAAIANQNAVRTPAEVAPLPKLPPEIFELVPEDWDLATYIRSKKS
jgi:hypothetical protein